MAAKDKKIEFYPKKVELCVIDSIQLKNLDTGQRNNLITGKTQFSYYTKIKDFYELVKNTFISTLNNNYRVNK